MNIETKLLQCLEEIVHLLTDINHRLQKQENTRSGFQYVHKREIAQKKEEQDSVAQQLEEQEGLRFIKDYPEDNL